MASRLETRRRMEQSHQTSGPMIITVPSYRISRVTTIRPSLVVKHMTWEEEELAMEKQKQSTTAKWVLNVIAAQEAYEKSLKEKSRFHHNKSKRPIRKPSRIEPMEFSSQSPFFPTTSFYPEKHQNNISQSSNPTIFSSTVIDHPSITHSSIISTKDEESLSKFDDYPSDEFQDGNASCISKRMMIILTIIAAIFIIGILLAVFLTIFVGKNGSSSSSNTASKSKTIDFRSICPTSSFSLPSDLCQNSDTYRSYSCSYWVKRSKHVTLRVLFEEDTFNDHWYIDDISAIQNGTSEKIVNGGFEMSLSGWKLINASNSMIVSSISHNASLAHSGSAAFYRHSSDQSVVLEQTLNVTEENYLDLTMWWRSNGIDRCPSFRLLLLEEL